MLGQQWRVVDVVGVVGASFLSWCGAVLLAALCGVVWCGVVWCCAGRCVQPTLPVVVASTKNLLVPSWSLRCVVVGVLFFFPDCLSSAVQPLTPLCCQRSIGWTPARTTPTMNTDPCQTERGTTQVVLDCRVMEVRRASRVVEFGGARSERRTRTWSGSS